MFFLTVYCIKCSNLRLMGELTLVLHTVMCRELHNTVMCRELHNESSLLINNQIHSHNTRTNNQMSILRVNRSKTKTLCPSQWYDNAEFFT